MADPTFNVLRLDGSTFAKEYGSEQHAELIADFSPIVVIYPEKEEDGPPWEGQATDYHPRSVDIYLSECRLRAPVTQLKSAKGWLASLMVSLGNGLLRDAAMLRPGDEVDLQAMVTQLFLQRQAESDPASKKPILPSYSLDSGVHGSKEAWTRYHTLLRNSPGKYARTCYATVVPQGRQLAITYWFFYYFNDYWNRHQADFESITVFFRHDEHDKPCPTGCAYAAHSEGLYRFWPEVIRLTPNDTHPIAFVGRGSHAFYPGPRLGGHIPTMQIERDFAKRVHYRLLVSPMRNGRPVEDTVVVRNAESIGEQPSEDYEIQVVPGLPQLTPDEPELWDKWWWLAYDGLWGCQNRVPIPRVRLGGINGPRRQGERWSNPWLWVRNCQLDGSKWSDAV